MTRPLQRSVTIVPHNRLALAPSLAVGPDCSRQSFGTRAIPGGRLRMCSSKACVQLAGAERAPSSPAPQITMHTRSSACGT